MFLAHHRSSLKRLLRAPLSRTPWPRTFSSSSHPPDGEVLLFERGPDQYALMRSGLGFSCFHTAYWLWYTTDFIPAVNASPMPELHIDPMLGLVGIGFAGLIQSIFMVFPSRLVSKLTYKPDRLVGDQFVPAQLWIYAHRLPSIRPSAKAAVVIDIAKQPKNWTLMDASEAQQVMGSLDTFLGRLAIRPPGGLSWPPYLLDFRPDSTIPDTNRLLQALVNPQKLSMAKEEEEDRFRRRGKKYESRLKSVARQRKHHKKRR